MTRFAAHRRGPPAAGRGAAREGPPGARAARRRGAARRRRATAARRGLASAAAGLAGGAPAPPPLSRDGRLAASRRRLRFVSGSRCLASLWIVTQHFSPHSSSGPLARASVKTLWRSNCAVDYFVVLSGFVTHWASRGAFVSTAGDGRFGAAAASWLARRFGRVLASTYLSMAVAVLLMSAEGDACNCAPAFGHVSRCAVLMEPWLSPSRWCPNGQVWTVAALAPAWLLYPAIFDRAFFNRPRRCLWAAAALLAALPTGVTLFLLWQSGGTLTIQQHYWLYLWPPLMLSDFALGAV
ncbi:hypothetical protein M885DRAFT_443077, partial [Pelagophyceae sp. CCMP2097]